MILRPVSPASPCGPPTTKRPVGLMRMSGSGASNPASPSTGRTTRAITPSRSSTLSILSECWVDTTTLAIPTGRAPSYTTLTWVLPSGRSHERSPALRTAASRSARRRASTVRSGRTEGGGGGMGQHDRERHEGRGLVRGVPEHHSLIARPALVHAHGDVARLAIDGREDGAGLRVEAAARVGVADRADRAAHDVGDMDVGGGGDLACYDGHARGDEGFARHPGG